MRRSIGKFSPDFSEEEPPFVIAACLVFSVVGFSGATWFFPWIASLAGRRSQSRSSSGTEGALSAVKVSVLIPCHNDVELLLRTLDSIRVQLPTRCELRVGLDACERGVAEKLASRRIEFQEFQFRSKWKTLEALTAQSQSDCVVFVDCGTLWSESLFSTALQLFDDPSVLAVSPSYAPKSGFFEALSWKLERFLKSLENSAGGPVSVHGATVFYRREALASCYAVLGRDTNWKNDDVILPYTARCLYPGGRIVYLTECTLADAGLAKNSLGLRRRLRMIAGNAEILIGIGSRPRLRRGIPLLLILRRMARNFWIYPILSLSAALILSLLPSLEPSAWMPVFLVGLIMMIFFRNKLATLFGAAVASMLAPVIFLSRRLRVKITW